MREIKFEYMFEDISEDERTVIKQIWNIDELEKNTVEYNKLFFIARRQYTGLKDRNGVEIYEGDILGVSKESEMLYTNQGNLQIVYIENTMSFELRDSSGELHRFINDYLKHIEVIGNIHENPELLNN